MEGHDCEVGEFVNQPHPPCGTSTHSPDRDRIIRALDHVVPSFVQASVAEWRQPPRSIGDALAQLRAETDKTSNSLFPEDSKKGK